MKGYEPSMVCKVHHNVQTMLAQARLILRPTPTLPPLKHPSFLEAALPTSKVLTRLKPSLPDPPHNYSRRQLRPLTKLQEAELTNKTRKTRSRNQLSTLRTSNSRLKGECGDSPALATFENELLELDRSSQMLKARESLSAARDKQPRYYLTISNQDIQPHPPLPPRKRRQRLKSLLLSSDLRSRPSLQPQQSSCSPWQTIQDAE